MKAFLSILRISNSPTVASNVLVGAALAGVTANWNVASVAIAMIFFYSAGMILNDLFDYEIDKVERPERPLPSGRISKKTAMGAAVFLFFAGFLILFKISEAAFYAGVVLFGLIIVYDLWHKKNRLSPFLMALCRIMVYVAAFLSFSHKPGLPLVLAAFGLGVYLMSLTYYAKHTSRHERIGWLVAGISLYDMLALLLLQAWVFALIAILSFIATIVFQRYIKGT